MPKSKAKAQLKHAQTRAYERYGLMLNRDDCAAIVKLIQNSHLMLDPQAMLLEKQSNRVSIWKVTYQDKHLIAVYDKERGTIASFLPPEFETMLKQQRSP